MWGGIGVNEYKSDTEKNEKWLWRLRVQNLNYNCSGDQNKPNLDQEYNSLNKQ